MKKLTKTTILSACLAFYSTDLFAQPTSGDAVQTKIIGAIATIVTLIIGVVLLFRVGSISLKMMNMGEDQRSNEEGQKLKTQLIWLISGSIVGFSASGVTIWLTGLFK